MENEKTTHCWDIMQCDDEIPCPVRDNKLDRCWEWMKKNNRFQFKYDLCNECIVYLYNNKSTLLAKNELEQAMIRRGLFEKGVYISDLHTLR